MWTALVAREENGLPFRVKGRFCFRQGTVIYSQGMPAQGLYVLCSGSVKLTTVTRNGADRIVAILNRGELFGYDSLFSSQRRFSAIARVSSSAYFIERKRFFDLLRSDNELLLRVVVSLAVAVHQLQEALVDISAGPVRERIQSALACWSLRLGQHFCVGPPTMIKQRELAQLIGIPEETISRELTKLRHAGWCHSPEGKTYQEALPQKGSRPPDVANRRA